MSETSERPVLYAYYNGLPDERIDGAIATLVGEKAIGSGYVFASDRRDIEFPVPTLGTGQWIAEKIRHAFPHVTAIAFMAPTPTDPTP